MRRFYRKLFLTTIVIIIGLFSVSPIFNVSAQEIPGTSQEIISPLKNLINIAEEFTNRLGIKISESLITKKIISYIPQNQEDLLRLLNRLTNAAGEVNRWLDTTVGINANVILHFTKTLMIGIFKMMAAAIREGISLMQ